MAILFKYIIALFQSTCPRERRSLRDLAAAVFLLCGSLQAQEELKFGDPDLFYLPFGTKIIDVGFRNWAYLNVSTVKHTDWLLLRWKSPDSTAKWLIHIGVPKCKLADKDFSLIPMFEIETDPACFNWLLMPIKIGSQEKYLLKVSGFDYVVKISSEDFYYKSQVRYIRQKP